MAVILGMGELLWDMFELGKVLGGAPTNFAYHAARMGHDVHIVSAVGNDELGDEIVDQVRQRGISTDYIQRNDYPTGTVLVELDAGGQPSYTITEDVAWDHLTCTADLEDLAGTCDAICFGSLAQRTAANAVAMQQVLGNVAGLKVFDVNLRQNWYSEDILHRSLEFTDVCKLNDDELDTLGAMFDLGDGSMDQQAMRLCGRYELELVCVTRGGNGCLLMNTHKMVEHDGVSIEVADTVGAGDAFTAAMVHAYLRNADLDTIADFANRVGAYVAGHNGGTPAWSDELTALAAEVR